MKDMHKDKELTREVEIRSEEVQEVMGKVPSWIIRWGITLCCIMILALMAGSYFFKYPDIITAQVKVTTMNPPAAVVSRTSGKIKKIYVSERHQVESGDYLAVIENSAQTDNVLLLKSQLTHLERNGHFSVDMSPNLQLGDIQSVYIAFLNAANDLFNFTELGFYEKRIDFYQKQLVQQEQYYERLKRQAVLTGEQLSVAARRWEKDSLMHGKGGISGSQLDNSLTSYLQRQQDIESAQASLESQQMQIVQLKTDLLTLQAEKMEQEGKIERDYEYAKEQLLIALKKWELQYALLSPISGQVTFTTYWSENHTIGTGETVFVVVPEEGANEIIGKALLPIARSGKVREGQTVNVRFDNYPDQEFGVVNGIVSSISLVPIEDNYIIGISFPKGLHTTYKRILPLSQEMTGSADIITDDLRLIERFFMPVKKILNEQE